MFGWKIRVSFLLFVTLLFLVLFVLNSELLFTFRKSNKSKVDDSMFVPLTKNDLIAFYHNLTLNREYQMKLYGRDFIERNESVQNFQNQLAVLLNLPELAEPGNETVRYQHIMNTTSCNKVYNLRTRNYYTGFRANTTTIDVKSSTDGIKGPESIIDKVWKPTDQYLDGAVQKFEWDIHPCKIKYSVESRIEAPFEHVVETCEGITELFETIKEKMNPAVYNNRLIPIPSYSGWWWELEHHGFLPDGITEYKTALTLEYGSYRSALAGTTKPIFSPEWSIRLWSSKRGRNRWVKASVADIDNRYQEVLAHFGTPDFPCPVLV